MRSRMQRSIRSLWPSRREGTARRCRVLVLHWIALAMLVVSGLAPMGLHAETLIVRSGEHPGFSRLVIDFGVVPRWRLSAEGSTRRFDFAGPSVTLETDEVFERIGRSRIRSVRGRANGLDVELGCDCVATAYGLPGGRFVIDVAAPETDVGENTATARPRVLSQSLDTSDFAPDVTWTLPSASLSEQTLDLTGAIAAGARPRQFADHELRRRPPAKPLIRSHRTPLPARQDTAPRLTGVRAPTQQGGRDTRDTPDAPLPEFSALEDLGQRTAAADALTEALNRAAEQGLVELETSGGRATANASAVDGFRSQGDTPLPLPVGEQPSLRISTSIDRDFAAVARTLSDNAGSDCLADYDLDVAAWGDPTDPMAGLSGLRAGILGEFDRPDPDAAKALARRYIYLSFGAEARAVLSAFRLNDNEAAILNFLAEIADGRTRAPQDQVTALLNCPGPAALWALLSVDAPPSTSEVATPEITGAFSDLPLHLRRHFGPALVERFLDLGNPDAARTVWEAVDRAAGHHGERFTLATAELAKAEGDVETAEATYGSLEDGSPENAPRAVLRLLTSRLSRGAAIDRSLVESAAALAYENRGTPLARELKVAELRGRIALDDWDTVFDELPRGRFAGALTVEDAERLVAQLYSAMAARANTEAFLARAAEAERRLTISVLSDPARRALADRLLDLGLPDRADSLLGGISKPEPADRLRTARARLISGQFAASLDVLRGLDAPEANDLRAKALLGLGRFEAASRAFMSAGDDENARRAAARGGLWALAPEPVQSAADPLVEREDPQLPDEPLARNRSLIADAALLREDISALLAVAGTPLNGDAQPN